MTIDQLMGKDDGLFVIIDEASRQIQDTSYIFDRIENRRIGQNTTVNVKVSGDREFAVNHYTGKLTYDANEIAEKNRDFVSPEMIETLRQSTDTLVQELFTNKLTKGGALTIVIDESKKEKPKKQTAKSKWGAALMQSEQTTNLRVSAFLV